MLDILRNLDLKANKKLYFDPKETGFGKTDLVKELHGSSIVSVSFANPVKVLVQQQ